MADRINSAYPGKYKIVVLHLKDRMKWQFEENIDSSSISIACKPKKLISSKEKFNDLFQLKELFSWRIGKALFKNFIY